MRPQSSNKPSERGFAISHFWPQDTRQIGASFVATLVLGSRVCIVQAQLPQLVQELRIDPPTKKADGVGPATFH
jgi:hypothetical protein